MAHRLNIQNNKASMFYTGEVPWHKLGTKLDNPATAEEAIIAAQLNYEVKKKKLLAQINEIPSLILDTREVPNTFATIRTDTNQVLGVVGKRYQVIQNKDAFNFFDSLVGKGEAIYHTAGVLDQGERIWILAKLPNYIRVGKNNDIVDKYLLLTNSHDGSSVIRAKLTPIRVVCNNTLSMALEGQEAEVHIRHTTNALIKLEEAHKILELTNVLYTQLDTIFNKMVLKVFSNEDLLTYIKTLVPDNPELEEQTNKENIREKILELYETGQGAELCKGTLWGAYNAVTEYTDHYQKGNDSKQLKSIWFGSKEQLKVKAFTLANNLLN